MLQELQTLTKTIPTSPKKSTTCYFNIDRPKSTIMQVFFNTTLYVYIEQQCNKAIKFRKQRLHGLISLYMIKEIYA